MRKYFRDNILDIFLTLRDGISFAETAENNAARIVLGDCADGVKSVKNALSENLSPERFNWYADKLNMLLDGMDRLANATGKSQRDLVPLLYRQIDGITRALKKESEVLVEIVFFPYKSSMWDSLESIWRAASADPRCAVSVVPIPHYEKDDHGRCVVEHCENELFPPEVIITDWREYDLSVMRPDIAYLHNVYDSNNRVTSVNPRYYTHELKKHVGTLVYSPYYASNSPANIQQAEVVVRSATDIVIAASEADRHGYLKCPQTADIAVLGSPKIDKVLLFEKSKPPLPEAWKNLRKKKIFFLNTSIGSLIKFGEYYFKKLAAILDIFSKRDDIGLLWRPHPLTRATLSSMCPHLTVLYERLEEYVRAGKFGVLDDSPDIQAAIALSDAYLGDGSSSLVYLYALTGKPLYILDFKIPAAPSENELRERESSEFFWDLLMDGDSAWGITNNTNAFCRINTRTGIGRVVSSVPNEKTIQPLYWPPVMIGGKMILSPGLARAWAIYDPETNSWEKIPLPPDTVPKLMHIYAFGGGMVYGKYAVFLPGERGAFARYDSETGEFSYYTSWFRKIEPYVKDSNNGLFQFCFCTVGNSLYLALKQCNIIAEVNVESMRVTLHSVGNPENQYLGIAYCGDKFWMTKSSLLADQLREGIVCWNPKNRETIEYNNLPITQRSGQKDSGLTCIRVLGNFVFAFPKFADAILKINPSSGEITRFEIETNINLYEHKSPYYGAPEDQIFFGSVQPLQDGRFITITPHGNNLLFIDSRTGRAELRELEISGFDKIKRGFERLNLYAYEDNVFLSAEHFIEMVLSGEIPAFDEEQAAHVRSINANSDGTCGQKIHKYVMMRNKKRGHF